MVVRYVPDHEAFLDSTRIILKYAQKNDMDVYVGLQEDSTCFTQNKWRDTQFLGTLSGDCCRLADTVQKRYGIAKAAGIGRTAVLAAEVENARARLVRELLGSAAYEGSA
jgi:hypothetical protein